jgi:hypothetical protein
MNSPSPPTRGPTIVLVGGAMTVDDGAAMDSRQPVEDDPWSLVSQLALTGSMLWWRTVLSVINPILAEGGEDTFCYVVGGKAVKEVRSDGSLTQRRLTAVLSGGSTNVKFDRPWERHQLPDDFVPHGSIGYKVDTTGKRWVFARIDQPPYTVAEAIGAKVVVDSGTWPYLHPDDLSMSNLERGTFSRFEAARVFSDVVLVLPHTYAVGAFLDSYVKWVAVGRRGAGQHELPGRTADGGRWRELRHSVPVPLTAEFKVTGVIQGGTWVDPSDFEAARSLLETRYDLKLGFWDLVGNAVLRQALLDSTPISAAPTEPAAVPPAAKARAAKRVDAAEAEVAARTESKEAIAKRLETHGWEQGHGIIYRLVDWKGQVEDHVLLYMTLSITKRRCAVTVATLWVSLFETVTSYLSAHAEELQEIAAPDECEAGETSTTIWRCKGGWADPIDWDERVAVIATKTLRWVEVFANLGALCRQGQADREAEQIAKFKSWDLEPDRRPT